MEAVDTMRRLDFTVAREEMVVEAVEGLLLTATEASLEEEGNRAGEVQAT